MSILDRYCSFFPVWFNTGVSQILRASDIDSCYTIIDRAGNLFFTDSSERPKGVLCIDGRFYKLTEKFFVPDPSVPPDPLPKDILWLLRHERIPRTDDYLTKLLKIRRKQSFQRSRSSRRNIENIPSELRHFFVDSYEEFCEALERYIKATKMLGFLDVPYKHEDLNPTLIEVLNQMWYAPGFPGAMEAAEEFSNQRSEKT